MKKYLTKYELRWAAIITVLSLLWTAFEYEMGWHTENIANHRYFTFLFLILSTLCYYFFFLDKRSNRFKKRFKFRHGFYSGLGLTLILALFSIPTQLLVHYLVSPDFLYEVQNHVVASGEMSENEAKNIFTINNVVIFFPVIYILYGMFISLMFANWLKNSSRKKR